MIARTYQALASAVEAATWVLTALLVGLVSANVFSRYVLESGILWAEEVSRLLFVWVVFLGSYVALRRGAHMAIDAVAERLPPSLQGGMLFVGRLLVLAFLATVAWSGFKLVATTVGYGRVTPILGISAGWAYLSVPVAAALMILDILVEMAVAGPLASPRTVTPTEAQEVEP